MGEVTQVCATGGSHVTKERLETQLSVADDELNKELLDAVSSGRFFIIHSAINIYPAGNRDMSRGRGIRGFSGGG